MPRKRNRKHTPPPAPVGPFYCVIDVVSSRVLYLGTDETAAQTASGDPAKTVCAMADSPGGAERAAAMLAGKMRPRSPRSRSAPE
jgi:hypothetical protein